MLIVFRFHLLSNFSMLYKTRKYIKTRSVLDFFIGGLRLMVMIFSIFRQKYFLCLTAQQKTLSYNKIHRRINQPMLAKEYLKNPCLTLNSLYYRSRTHFSETFHEAGFSSVNKNIVQTYLKNLSCKKQVKWADSVLNLERTIYGDPLLRYNWENGISKAGNLKGKNGKNVLQMLNAVLTTPPAFDTKELVGFPINAIFNDFMQNENGRMIFSNYKVNNALKELLREYADMLESPFSLAHMNDEEPTGWFSPTASALIDYSQYEIPSNGFRNWNQWFLRKFKPNLRPVGAGTPWGLKQQNVIINACESCPLIYPYQPVREVKIQDNFWLKDDRYSLQDMLGSYGVMKGYCDLFAKGTIYQAFLNALAYHHWHAPVDGKIVDIYKIPGTYFLDRSQFNDVYDQASPNNSQSFLTATATRMVVLIKAKNQKIGYIAIIFVGMAEVSSCVASQRIGKEIRKGDHLGHFAYGGSTHAILFQKKAKLVFNQNLYQSLENEKIGKIQKLSSYLAHLSED